ncbi:hypothetical protein DM02DRAFT_611081 [Periconia macrospinosa]|uniref:Uncharacterized protein n=1 Tax=Periconia macrospinosa TaxID=97972 RepID=A0A2V1E3D0_9PLEO|nr:hypothetical protein DM02DRAFT_611081 [Periconia macrospinosa]
MAARGEQAPTIEDDPAAASDAVSLHTIAEQADAYEAQEQEDADFALALALEEQESARFASPENVTHPGSGEPIESRAVLETEPLAPYRDNPEADENIDPPPYRDDPDAEPAEGEQPTDPEAATAPPQRQHIVLRILRKIVKAWLCYLICSTVFTFIVIIAVLILAFIYGDKKGTSLGDPKEAAWLASGSEDYTLNLPKLYPALHESTSDTCKETWEDVASSLPCHRMILSPAWDNGNATEAKEAGADPVYYRDAVCTRACKTALKNLDIATPATCVNRANRFDFDSYGKDGKAYFEANSLEEGPAGVSQSLLARYDRLCSGPPKKYFGKNPLSCAEDLWMNWGIVDGKNEANLNGLDSFLEQTSVKKTIPASRETVVKLTRSGRNSTFTRNVNSRRVGPGRRETECNDCLQDWLARKTLSFRYGEILQPGTRTPVGLAEFSDKMKSASQRCYTYADTHTRIWEAMGWWCDGAPCRNDDDSIPWNVINVLHGYDKEHSLGLPSLSLPNNVPSNKREPVRALLTAVQDMRCGAIGLTPTDLNNPFLTSAHVISRLCTPRCLNTVDRISDLAEAAEYPSTPLTSITESIDTVRTLCKSSSPISFATTPDLLCASSRMNLTSPTSPTESTLSLTSSSPSVPPVSRASILSTFRTGIENVDAWNRNSQYSNALQSHEDLKKLRIAESACNTCDGEIFIGQDGKWKETVDAFLKDPDVNSAEYVKVARQGWVVCADMYGLWLPPSKRRQLFEKVGLGDGVA